MLRADHPRSRGVYALWTTSMNKNHGSSPLARGLRDSPPATEDPRGIIPARAGFTGQGTRPAPPKPGSSPLARGLPGLAAGPDGWDRIIPARAGFTQRHLRGLLRPSDHPRSRGVYLVVDGDGDRAEGIIPARAGFTPSGRTTGH